MFGAGHAVAFSKAPNSADWRGSRRRYILVWRRASNEGIDILAEDVGMGPADPTKLAGSELIVGLTTDKLFELTTMMTGCSASPRLDDMGNCDTLACQPCVPGAGWEDWSMTDVGIEPTPVREP